MRIFAIGDVQGCYRTLIALLKKIEFNKKNDQLWFVGDLVNRGKDSDKVLDFVMDLGESAKVVLGNHELNLLATYEGLRKQKELDTMSCVLESSRCETYLDWIKQLPLVHADQGNLMVHAGLHPGWDEKQALKESKRLSKRIRNDTWHVLWKGSKKEPPVWDEDADKNQRDSAALAYFIGVRTIDKKWRVVKEFDGHPEDCPNSEWTPWFEVRAKKMSSKVVFGHWAGLGFHHHKNFYGIDSGCVWGGSLTALRIDSKKPSRTYVSSKEK